LEVVVQDFKIQISKAETCLKNSWLMSNSLGNDDMQMFGGSISLTRFFMAFLWFFVVYPLCGV
jgi:hypothetical protein